MSKIPFYCTWPIENSEEICWQEFKNQEQRTQHHIYEHPNYINEIRKGKYRKHLKNLKEDPLEKDPF